MARDPWLDNAKFTLITLVVFGHALAVVLVSELHVQLYTWIYLFHMPAFVMISGHLSRGFQWSPRHLTALASTLLVPFLIFEAAIFWWREHLGQEQSGTLWLDPHWSMWYLIVLAMWRLATPLLRWHWALIPLSVPVSIWAGTWELTLFDIPKAFAMLPFFLLGLHAKPSWLPLLGTWWARTAAVAALVALWPAAATVSDWARVAFLWWDRSYAVLGYADGESSWIRIRLLAMGLVGALAVLALIPRRASFMTGLGSASLLAYLFHGFPIRWAESNHIHDWALARPYAALLVVALASIAWAVVLTSPWVARWLRWLADPVGTWRGHRTAAQPLGAESAPEEPVRKERPLADAAGRIR